MHLYLEFGNHSDCIQAFITIQSKMDDTHRMLVHLRFFFLPPHLLQEIVSRIKRKTTCHKQMERPNYKRYNTLGHNLQLHFFFGWQNQIQIHMTNSNFLIFCGVTPTPFMKFYETGMNFDLSCYCPLNPVGDAYKSSFLHFQNSGFF